MSALLDIASWALLLAGAAALAVSGLGLLRLPDVFTRLHAAGIADTGGAALLLTGMALQLPLGAATVKLALIAIVLWLTAPTASYAIGHAALTAGLAPGADGDANNVGVGGGAGAESEGGGGR